MRLWIYNRTREINDSLIVFEWIFVPWLGAVKIKISNKLRLCPGTPIFNKNMSRCLIWSAYSDSAIVYSLATSRRDCIVV